MKPLADAEVSKQYRCDERWYDWFSIPNYHLGNGYENPDPANPGTCYTPCQAGSLPAFQLDPVDGQNLHFIPNEENNGQCISRANYFGGKYAAGTDYCPLSWIYILNSSPQSLENLVNKNNQQFASSDMANDVLTSAFNANQNNSKSYANNIYNSLPIELNNKTKFNLKLIRIWSGSEHLPGQLSPQSSQSGSGCTHSKVQFSSHLGSANFFSFPYGHSIGSTKQVLP
jgi:hypothetical protein